jgi:hypothetical protein
MKTLLLVLFLFPATIFSKSSPASAHTVYVSPSGNDRWSGKLSAPNKEGTDGPVATLERARDVARIIRGSDVESRKSAKSNDTIFVMLRGGTYARTQTLHLSILDGGTASAPVVWRPYRGESVRLSGGVWISNLTPVTDTTMLRRLPAAIRTSVVRADLRTMGITDYGSITPRGNPGLELFYEGNRMQLARWPNAEWLRIADVPQTGDTMYNKGLDREKRFDGVPAGRHYGRFTYNGSRPSGWSTVDGIFVHGYWTFDWSDSFQKVERIDTAAHEITLALPHHHYGYTRNQRYYFLNVLEELDAPGEWYLDRGTGMLYFLAPGGVPPSTAEVSLLESPLVALDSCSHVAFQGISFEVSRGNGVVIEGGTGNTLNACTFRNLGGDAVVIGSGTHHRVLNSQLRDLARAGIVLRGGDRLTLARGDNEVYNTHIHHYSTWLRTGNYAVVMDGVGQTMKHCLIHDAPFEGVYIKGNDHLISFNEMHSILKESGDAGAIHTGRNWTWRGNVITNNYFHDLRGPGLHGVMGVYLDDWGSGFRVEGNVFYRAGRASMIGGGRDNIIRNNIYVECQPSLHYDARGLGWASYFFDGTLSYLFDGLKEVNHANPPYSTRYPELALLPGKTAALPENNLVTGNVSWGGRWMDIYDYLAFDINVSTFRGNYVADTIGLRRRMDGEKGWDPYYLDIDWKEGFEALANTDPRLRQTFPRDHFLAAPPLAFDPKTRRFSIPPGSPLKGTGFRIPPIEKMGLLKQAR